MVPDPAVIEALIAAGVDPKARDEGGAAPLHTAAAGYLAVVEALIEGGGDPKARDKYGTTPLHWAALGATRRLLMRCWRPARTLMLALRTARRATGFFLGALPRFIWRQERTIWRL